MSQKIWSSLTTAALIITTLGNTASSYASQPNVNDNVSEANVPQEQPNSDQSDQTDSSASPTNAIVEAPVLQGTPSSAQVATTLPLTDTVDAQLDEVSKVGEYQSQEETEDEDAIAIIQPHTVGDRQAATLYVRNIPVLTFLGSSSPSTEVNPGGESSTDAGAEPNIKIGTTQASDAVETSSAEQDSTSASAELEEQAATNHPVQRATSMAARVNQLYLNRIDAEAITARWHGDQQQYVIEINGEVLVGFNSDTILPDSTNDPAEDALQATNRLRRLIGNAPPLRDIAGRPEPARRSQSSGPQVSLGSVRSRLTGIASWYGPGFHGNRSASGEVFNQNAMTAAHRSLPFGTQVRVTSLNTGLAVVVRITDRGPFSRGRIIDLSAGAARVIGLVRSGVAPVRVDVLGSTRTASN